MTAEPTPTAEKSIWMPYDWSTGEAIGTFLTGLREGEIVAAVCEECGGKHIVPARSFCKETQEPIDTFETVSDAGTVSLHTVVRTDRPTAPIEPPYALALISLDGADTELLHLIAGSETVLQGLETGDRVSAVWRPPDEREGSILDIEHFTPEDTQ